MSTPNSKVDALFTTVYDQLRVSAHHARLHSPGNTLNTTLLVHELYVRMRKSIGAEFSGKAQFFAYAGRALRSIMVDHARTRIAERARLQEIAVLDAIEFNAELLSPEHALALDAALKKLEAEDARAAAVVELHFFAGLSLVEIGEQLELTTRTIDRDWQYARAFLKTLLTEK